MTAIDSQSVYQTRDRTFEFGIGLVLIGAWLVSAPFILRYTWHPTPVLNDIVVGLLTIVLSILTTVNPSRFRALIWVSCYLGFWLVAAPFVLSYLSYDLPNDGAVPMWNSIICGLIVWLLSYLKATCQAL